MLAEQRTNSPSPSRRISLGSKISALGAKLTRTLSQTNNTPNDEYEDEDGDSISTVLHKTNSERSLSRGRDVFQSTGRGGLGNMRHTSKSRDARPSTGPDDFSVTRGREPISSNQVFSTGRGGAGNLRSPSRDPAGKPSVDLREEEVIRDYVAANEGATRSSGRGGLGNMSARSRSRDPASPSTFADRSRSREPTGRFSTGRGGAGNILAGDGHIAEVIDEDERKARWSTANDGPAIHSTGRGGAANLTATQQPNIEQPPHRATQFESTGRGGAGNIVRDRSRSRPRA